jgi:plastocyanin
VVLTRLRTVLVTAAIGVAAAVAAASGGAGPSALPQASSLRGRVQIGHYLTSSRPAPHPGMDSLPEVTPPEVYQQAVVYLDPPPERLEHPVEAHARMDQRGERFIPHLLAIATGTLVDFPNDDRIYHNVFSLSKPKRFDLGRYAAGHSKAIRFDEPGIVRVFCEIHSHMNAFILVFDHRYFATTDDEGRFRIDRVPPGTYRLTAWYEGVLRETQTVSVPTSGAGEATFVLK